MSRSALKAAIERTLTKTVTVIADDLNYIKGYRYELFCIARAVGTTMCTIHCDATTDEIVRFNAGTRAYNESILAELPQRFERPNDRNRWERPLFVVRPEDDRLPLEDIVTMIEGKSLNPNLATVSQPVADKNMLHEIDVVTAQILAALQNSQTEGVMAGRMKFPYCSKAVTINRVVPMGEQRRIKRQFMKVVTDDGQTPSTSEKAAEMFVDFLVAQIAQD
eukprot:768452-Hanusia_phi.AAC.8